jgi:antitoxin (DNA-binding transcriptional repressor) of toxin-antitoxin stability system
MAGRAYTEIGAFDAKTRLSELLRRVRMWCPVKISANCARLLP